MNERIRELAEQALFESDFDDEQNIKITMDIFAELIVRECANVILEWKSEPFPYDPEFGAKIICKHFGVEL